MRDSGGVGLRPLRNFRADACGRAPGDRSRARRRAPAAALERAGEYFRLGSGSTEHLVLQQNGDPHTPGHWMEPQHSDWPYLLYINETNRSAELAAQLTVTGNVALIRHEVF